VADTLAYCDTGTITAVKSFIVQAPEQKVDAKFRYPGPGDNATKLSQPVI
jgi:hypothetical protein